MVVSGCSGKTVKRTHISSYITMNSNRWESSGGCSGIGKNSRKSGFGVGGVVIPDRVLIESELVLVFIGLVI